MSDGFGDLEDEGTPVPEQRFAIVPEWVIDADISDSAYRLYSVLLPYGQTSGHRMPGRALLATRLKKRSKNSVDRTMQELVAVGAVVVEHRKRGGQHLTNRYHLMSTPPDPRRGPPSPEQSGSHRSAATRVVAVLRPGEVTAGVRLPLIEPMRPRWPQACGPTQ